MGIIKAAVGAIGGTLADQWLEVVEPSQINNSTLVTFGVRVRKNDSRNSNTKNTADLISNGAIIHVPENVYMLLVDGGKIISITDEAGYYKVDNSRSPSIFDNSSKEIEVKQYSNQDSTTIIRRGGLKSTLKDSWERFKFGGTTPNSQKVIYVNKQEIPGIRFGTRNPVPYTDRALVPGRIVPCKITSYGTYSLKISDPILFYSEVCNKSGKENFTTDDFGEQYLNEFLMAYTTALAKLSTENITISDVPIKTMELGSYMADVLDNEWLSKRGFFIYSVGIAGISFDDKTNELLEKYGNDSILFDPTARAARMTGSISKGLENAGSNEGGAMLGFAGMSMGMNAAGAMGAMPNQQTPQQPSNQESVRVWTCKCGNTMPEQSAFCSKCGSKKIDLNANSNSEAWVCECGKNVTEGKFCSNCGSKMPENKKWTCKCGYNTQDMFCSKCGTKRDSI